MKYRYRIDPSNNLIIDKFEGNLCPNAMLNSLQLASQDPDYKLRMDVLSDMTEARLDMENQDIRQLAGTMSPIPNLRYNRIAIVTSEKLQYGLFRMMGSVSDVFDIYNEFQVYSDFSQAKKWLGLPDNYDPKI